MRYRASLCLSEDFLRATALTLRCLSANEKGDAEASPFPFFSKTLEPYLAGAGVENFSGTPRWAPSRKMNTRALGRPALA